MANHQKTLLISIDGWGVSSEKNGNAVHHAQTPVMDHLTTKKDQYCELNASGLYVGLPDGVMGNSEVGHLTMGAGRELYTDLVKINLAIEDGSFAKKEPLVKAFEAAKSRNSKLHFLGLLSDGGVHSHINHLFEFLKAAKAAGVPNTFVHAFMDGRDTPPNSGHTYVTKLMNFCKEQNYAKLSTLVGRYYAMDRDTRWERIEKAYNLLTKQVGTKLDYDVEKVVAYLKNNYEKKIFDELMEPAFLLPEGEGTISDNDVLIFIDFRSDRMREIVETFGMKPPFKTDIQIKNLLVNQMTEYSSKFQMPILYPPVYVKNSLSEVISTAGLKQYHTAETEKYAHVTFFFNGRNETQFALEDRKLVASPNVATYDMKADMSMYEVTDEVVKALEQNYDFVMCNFAPPDMVGHTGNYEKTVEACTHTDKCIGKLVEMSKKLGYVLIITSDHGNAEEMLDANGKPKTSHNCNLVPMMLINPDNATKVHKISGNKNSSLTDVAPTILEIMDLPIPSEMTGKSLLVK